MVLRWNSTISYQSTYGHDSGRHFLVHIHHIPGHALDHAYTRKVNGAEEECRRQGIAFLPLVAESFGGWHSGAVREVKKLGAALARHTGQDEAEAVSHLWGRLGILLQRGNAAIIGNRVPALPDAHIDGIL